MNLLEEFKNDTNAILIIKEWVGEGGIPVESSRAFGRANVCRQCPENVKGKWWEQSKDAIASTIRDMLAFKNKLDLQLPDEEELGMCHVCGCCNILKPWTPLQHILNHTNIGVMEKYPEHCYIKTEAKPL